MATNAKTDACYCRYSSESQRDSTSIAVQIEQCERAAGHSLARFIDEARTGRGMVGRENLHRLLADASAGFISRVFVSRYDRLGRNESDCFNIVEELEQAGVEVLSATESKDAVTRGMMVVLAAHYSRELAVKTRNGLIQRHRDRRFTGGRPSYGYRIVDLNGHKVLAIDEAEAAIVRAVFAAYLGQTPVGYKAIAKMLNARGVPTRSLVDEKEGRAKRNLRINRYRAAKPWAMTSIRHLLMNEMYVGLVTYNRRHMKLNREPDKRVPILNDPSLHLSYRDPALQIISDEQFQRARTRLGVRATATGEARAAASVRAFTGHLFCEACGAAFYSRKSENSKGSYVYYGCGCRQRRGPDACVNKSTLREDKLLESLQLACAAAFSDIEQIVTMAMGDATAVANRIKADADRLRGQLRETDAEIGKFTRLLKDPSVVAEPMAFKILLRHAAEAESKREIVQQALDALLTKSNDEPGVLAARIRSKALEAKERWGTVVDSAQMNRLIADFVGPSLVSVDSHLLPVAKTSTAPENSGAMHGFIAGGGFEPPTSGL